MHGTSTCRWKLIIYTGMHAYIHQFTQVLFHKSASFRASFARREWQENLIELQCTGILQLTEEKIQIQSSLQKPKMILTAEINKIQSSAETQI